MQVYPSPLYRAIATTIVIIAMALAYDIGFGEAAIAGVGVMTFVMTLAFYILYQDVIAVCKRWRG